MAYLFLYEVNDPISRRLQTVPALLYHLLNVSSHGALMTLLVHVKKELNALSKFG